MPPSYTIQPNGDLLYHTNPPDKLNNYRKITPRLFRPDFPDCRYHQINCKTLPCGKNVVTFSCRLHTEYTTLTPPICHGCTDIISSEDIIQKS